MVTKNTLLSFYSLVLYVCLGFFPLEAVPIIHTYTDPVAFSAILPTDGHIEGFEGLAPGTDLPAGSALGPLILTHSVQDMPMRVVDSFSQASAGGTNILGLPSNDEAFLSGESIEFGFEEPVVAVGMSVIASPGDVRAGDINLSATTTFTQIDVSNTATPWEVLPDGGELFFLGIVLEDADPTELISSAILISSDIEQAGLFVFNLDNIQAVPLPALDLQLELGNISENGGISSATVSRNTGTSGNLVIDLASDNILEATVPATVTIPDGQVENSFQVTAVDEAVVDGTQTVTISAVATGFVAASDTIDVTDDDTPTLSLSITDSSINENAGTAATTATITRNTDTTSALTVDLLSDDTSEATLPTTADIPTGQNSVIVDIDAVDDEMVDGTQTVVITASTSGFTDGTNNLDVLDDDVPTLSLTMDPSVNENGGTANAMVSRNTSTTDVLMVDLVSTDSSEASVPVSVTIPSGQEWVDFLVSGVDDTLVDGNQTVTIQANAVGYTPGEHLIEVIDDDGTCQIGAALLTGPMTFTGIETHQSEGSLTTEGSVVVGTGADVLFEAVTGITLGPGFQVQDNAYFEAHITDDLICFSRSGWFGRLVMPTPLLSGSWMPFGKDSLILEPRGPGQRLFHAQYFSRRGGIDEH